jgi:hypothetical protein
MFRLIIFQELAELLGVKDFIDPMPGIFAGKLSRAQAFFNLLYKSLSYYEKSEEDSGDELLIEGIKEIGKIKKLIDKGEVKERLIKEKEEWRNFIKGIDSADIETTKEFMNSIII